MENKVCRRCKKAKPIKEFETKRHKICKPCRIKRAMAGVAYAEWHAVNKPATPPEPIGLTTTPDGNAKYHREYYRGVRQDPNRKEPLFHASKKLCRRCQVKKDPSEFGSWRVRVCLACDGPSLADLINNPPRPRS